MIAAELPEPTLRDRAQAELIDYRAIAQNYRQMVKFWGDNTGTKPEYQQGLVHELDRSLDKLMTAKTGEELYHSHRQFNELIQHMDEKHELNKDEVDSLKFQADRLCKKRQAYLGKAHSQKSKFKTRLKYFLGTGLICTALALTVVGAPLIPAAAIGGAVLAYGVVDTAKEMAEGLTKKGEIEPVIHEQNFNAVKDSLKDADKSYTKAKIAEYQPKPVAEHKADMKLEKKAKRKKTLKRMGKFLAIAGLGLAVAALAAVFPPVGVPVLAATIIGAVSVATLGGAGAVVAKEYFNEKNEEKAHKEQADDEIVDAKKRLEDIENEVADDQLRVIPEGGSTRNMLEDESPDGVNVEAMHEELEEEQEAYREEEQQLEQAELDAKERVEQKEGEPLVETRDDALTEDKSIKPPNPGDGPSMD